MKSLDFSRFISDQSFGQMQQMVSATKRSKSRGQLHRREDLLVTEQLTTFNIKKYSQVGDWIVDITENGRKHFSTELIYEKFSWFTAITMLYY